MNHSQPAKLVKKEQDHAVLQFQNGETLNWPLNLLPEANPSDTLRVSVRSNRSENEEREALARAILNEILS